MPRLPAADPAGLLAFHRFLLGETNQRLSLYQQAIAAHVKPGAAVLDLGSGSGVLAFLACMAGARRVYAIEMDDSRELGRVLARANGFDDRIEFFEGLSRDVQLPEQVDVIVSDIHGTFGLKKNGLDATIDARRRFLKPGGAMIPHAVNLVLAPVESAVAYDQHVDFWNRRTQGIDLSAVREVATNSRHPVRLARDMFLAEPGCLVRLDLMQLESAGFQGRAPFTMQRAGTLHGFGGWFRSELAGDLSVTSDPTASTTNFSQTFFPAAHPVAVAAGDMLGFSLASFDNVHWRWEAELRGVTLSRSNFHGFLPADVDPSHK